MDSGQREHPSGMGGNHVLGYLTTTPLTALLNTPLSPDTRMQAHTNNCMHACMHARTHTHTHTPAYGQGHGALGDGHEIILLLLDEVMVTAKVASSYSVVYTKI